VLVYLYNCDQGGTITNYATCTISGTSYVGMRGDMDAEAEDGVARFNGLKPGYYKAMASRSLFDIGEEKQVSWSAVTPVFEVKRGATVPPMALVFEDFDALTIQTCETSNADRQAGDTIIRVYNSLTGPPIIDFDMYAYDTVVCLKPTKLGTYWIQVVPYTTAYGEYALWLSTSGGIFPPAPGTFAEPGSDGIKGGETTTRSANSQLIKMDDKIVYGDMTVANAASGDWYRFEVK
jgi:hypothetical protein